jgi:predicted DNA-binding transcriptional regulator YafY
MRADRLLSILLLLQIHGRMTAQELADRFEVSRRTIYRDMDALSGAGVPVLAERGNGGGWNLLDGYQTNLTGLNQAEIQTLFLPVPDRLLADLGLDRASEAAFIKLLTALPSMQRRDAEYIRQRIHIDVSGGERTDEDVSFLPILQEAVWQERRLKLRYHLSTGPLVEPLLEPLGLVAKGSVWYLVASFDQAINVYRVSRIIEATMIDQPVRRPDNFDLARFWVESSVKYQANRPRYPVRARVAAAVWAQIRQRLCWYISQENSSAGRGGWLEVDFEFESAEEACGFLLSFGSMVEILTPVSLRDQLVRLAEEVLDMYPPSRSQYAVIRASAR